MMERTTLRDRVIQVLVENGHISIEKCDEVDNFDEHGCDWALPLESVQEAQALVRLLTRAIKIADIRTEDEDEEDEE